MKTLLAAILIYPSICMSASWDENQGRNRNLYPPGAAQMKSTFDAISARKQREDARNAKSFETTDGKSRTSTAAAEVPNDASLEQESASLMPEWQTCRKETPNSEAIAQLVLSFEVSPEGTVAKERVLMTDGPKAPTALFECVLAKLRTHHFARKALTRKAPHFTLKF